MATRIRLKRLGKRNRPFYRIVVMDQRKPRDGKATEEIGYYDPMTDPATIEVDAERAQYWLSVGAQPSDGARTVLTNAGVLEPQEPTDQAAASDAEQPSADTDQDQTEPESDTAEDEQQAEDAGDEAGEESEQPAEGQ